MYRANRLIQWGGWSRVRTVDEHTKLARIAIDFAPDLDSAFGINISKAIVNLPSDLKEDLEPITAQVARIAQQRYRKGAGRGRPLSPPRRDPTPAGKGSGGRTGVPSTSQDSPAGATGGNPVGGHRYREAITSAARAAGEQEAMERIVSSLRRLDAEVAHDLGW